MKKIIITALILLTGTANAISDDLPDNILQIPEPDNKVVSIITFEMLTNALNNIKINSENSLEGIQRATARYTQTNVVAAYKDFSKIINSVDGNNDFLYITLAQRLDNLGFFTLGQNAVININDTELWRNSINALKQVYSPSVTLTYDEEILLAKLQTAILYNNSAKEAIKELEDNDKLLKKSDYANYILAIGYFENKNYNKALNTINKAISKAPDCVNYLRFKEKIYTRTGDYKAALKIINKLEKSGLISNFYKSYIYKDKLYILSKMSKKDKSKYYSAKLALQEGDYQKAVKDAQSAISVNKKNLDAYILIGDYYLKNDEPVKAYDYYSRASKINPKYSPILMGLGHYYFSNKDYNTAYEYYLKAYKHSSQNENVLISLANCLIAKNDNKNASDYLKKVLKINPNSDTAYYLLSKITPKLKEQYLRTSLSYNPINEFAWLDLAELKISEKDFKSAKEYIFPVKLIDPENSRYIYLKKLIDQKNNTAAISSENKQNTLKVIFN